MEQLRTPATAAAWLRQRVRGHLRADSRQVSAGDGFIAWPGFGTDGRAYVEPARAAGASACLIERDGAEGWGFQGDAVASYDGLKAASGPIAAQFYGEPTASLQVLAVTGTNGKTSTAWWLAQALSHLPDPRRCAMVGTLGIGTPPALQYTGLTTPDPVLLQKTFRDLADGGFTACAIEASSIGIAERRLDGTHIHTAVFTNFTQDHLDYHGSMDAYWQAKAELFGWPGLAATVVNIDDPQGLALVDRLADGVQCWTIGVTAQARLMATDIGYGPQGLVFDVVEAAEGAAPQRARLATALIGDYNVHNLLGVIATLRTLDVSLADAVRACGGLTPVPGRMQRVPAGEGQPVVVVDYAHTPDALDKVLAALRPLTTRRGGRLWCLFGCGGDRDPVKRPMMAAVAEKGADVVVVTSDNPRSEKPEAIVSQILLGLARPDDAQVQVDRAQAIADTLAQAAAGDVVLLAGKGHEAWQEIGGERLPFSDVHHASAALANRGGA
ncbi:MAG: UDP-N-acetylmuramoyl-L-alanyl-D-glutamate--2,6-diaminopimelate ligase [Burkholderiaceae bacterium]|nr:UDP-N-acetylmuramoyl-L-alanyl-D-glutamate--2,6-diaminopimelate ligase [Burkholderiaceae bacterium]